MKISIVNDSCKSFWLIKLKILLVQNGFAEVSMYPDSADVKSFIPFLKTRLVDNYLVVLRNGLNVCTSMVFK